MTAPAYAAPSVGSAGLTVPTYASILADNVQAYLNIYGSNQYVESDSAIYQLLSVISLKNADVCSGLQLAYNQSSPTTAVGTGLDRAAKLNGLTRDVYTYSTAVVTCAGTAGVPLVNAVAQDTNGYLWSLGEVTIPGSVVATCTTPGAISAEPGTINIISTPVNGWASVTNNAAATVGAAVESDSALRSRQAISVSLPALTPMATTVAVVLSTAGVTRVAPGYPTPGGPGTSIENPTGSVDSWGNPAHSISIVVEGGSDLTVATAIYSRKTIGCLTNGTTSVLVDDPNVMGMQETISFYRPSYVPIYVSVSLHGYSGALTSSVQTAVQTAITNYLNELAIGETVSISAVSYMAMSVNANLPAPTFGVQALTVGTSSSPTGVVDVPMPTFYSAATGLPANVIVTVV